MNAVTFRCEKHGIYWQDIPGADLEIHQFCPHCGMDTLRARIAELEKIAEQSLKILPFDPFALPPHDRIDRELREKRERLNNEKR